MITSLRLFLIQMFPSGWDYYVSSYQLHYAMQIPDTRTGDDIIDAVVVDEEAVGLEGKGRGGRILNGKGALDRYLSQQKQKDVEGSEGEAEAEPELPSVVASM